MQIVSRARHVPDWMRPGGNSRSLAVRRAKLPQASMSAGRPRIVTETSQADSVGSILRPVHRGTSPPLGEQPDKIVVGFLGRYRLHDFPTTICEEPD
jgi:hypothetical protein